MVTAFIALIVLTLLVLGCQNTEEQGEAAAAPAPTSPAVQND